MHPEETVICSRYDQIFIPASTRRNSAASMHLENVLGARDISNIWALDWKRRCSNNAGESRGEPVRRGQEKSITARPLSAAFARCPQSSSTAPQRYTVGRFVQGRQHNEWLIALCFCVGTRECRCRSVNQSWAYVFGLNKCKKKRHALVNRILTLNQFHCISDMRKVKALVQSQRTHSSFWFPPCLLQYLQQQGYGLALDSPPKCALPHKAVKPI